MSHHLAKVGGEEVLDGDCATAVELHNLVVGVAGSSTDNIGSSGSLLECDGICLVR